MILTVAPLSTPAAITAAAQRAIMSAERLFIQTEQHPSAYWLKGSGLKYESMDKLYEDCYDFDELNEAIAEKLFEEEKDTVYAPVGRGAGEALMAAIKDKAAEKGAKIKILASSGYAEAALAAAGMPFSMGNARILSANELPCGIDTRVPLCVEEVDTPIRAGEVKLALSEYYPDEHEITLAYMDEKGEYSCENIKLYELDRKAGKYFAATVLMVPPVALEGLERHGVDSLVEVVGRLRAEGGCPWDREQTHESLRNTMIEEAYEAVDAIERGDMDALCEELGDVLLQVVFHAQLETEASDFTIRDVTTGIVKKLIYRHPHVFSTVSVSGTEEVLKNWEVLKKKEKHMHTATETMRAVPDCFPALMRAGKLQKRAGAVGYDIKDVNTALDALTAACERLRKLYGEKAGEDELYVSAEELLFSAVYVMRALKLDAEITLRDAGNAFLNAFAEKERLCAENGTGLGALDPDKLHELWQTGKQAKNKDFLS